MAPARAARAMLPERYGKTKPQNRGRGKHKQRYHAASAFTSTAVSSGLVFSAGVVLRFAEAYFFLKLFSFTKVNANSAGLVCLQKGSVIQ